MSVSALAAASLCRLSSYMTSENTGSKCQAANTEEAYKEIRLLTQHKMTFDGHVHKMNFVVVVDL